MRIICQSLNSCSSNRNTGKRFGKSIPMRTSSKTRTRAASAPGTSGGSRRRTAEHGLSNVRLSWARTSGTSCAVACHAESERLLVPLGGRGKLGGYAGSR
jgi:hypothetical protein